MARQTAYSPGPDIGADEIVRDRLGRVVDDAYAESAAEEAMAAGGVVLARRQRAGWLPWSRPRNQPDCQPRRKSAAELSPCGAGTKGRPPRCGALHNEWRPAVPPAMKAHDRRTSASGLASRA
jgi:hypothetical protein